MLFFLHDILQYWAAKPNSSSAKLLKVTLSGALVYSTMLEGAIDIQPANQYLRKHTRKIMNFGFWMRLRGGGQRGSQGPQPVTWFIFQGLKVLNIDLEYFQVIQKGQNWGQHFSQKPKFIMFLSLTETNAYELFYEYFET